MLDGGHILIMALESVARRDFSLQVNELMHLAGMVALLLLMVTIVYNDLTCRHNSTLDDGRIRPALPIQLPRSLRGTAGRR
jgi:hypothetical protein